MFRNIRQEIIDILDDTQILYTIKVKRIEKILRNLSKDYVQFIDQVQPEVQQQLTEQITCTTNCSVKSYCLIGKNKICIPKTHLVSGKDNDMLYYVRAMKFDETPDYDYLINLMAKEFNTNNFKNDGKYEWN